MNIIERLTHVNCCLDAITRVLVVLLDHDVGTEALLLGLLVAVAVAVAASAGVLSGVGTIVRHIYQLLSDTLQTLVVLLRRFDQTLLVLITSLERVNRVGLPQFIHFVSTHEFLVKFTTLIA